MKLEFDYIRPSQTIWVATRIFNEIDISPWEVVKVILTKDGIEELWYQKGSSLSVWSKRTAHYEEATLHLTKESAIQRAINEGRAYTVYD